MHIAAIYLIYISLLSIHHLFVNCFQISSRRTRFNRVRLLISQNTSTQTHEWRQRRSGLPDFVSKHEQLSLFRALPA